MSPTDPSVSLREAVQRLQESLHLFDGDLALLMRDLAQPQVWALHPVASLDGRRYGDPSRQVAAARAALEAMPVVPPPSAGGAPDRAQAGVKWALAVARCSPQGWTPEDERTARFREVPPAEALDALTMHLCATQRSWSRVAMASVLQVLEAGGSRAWLDQTPHCGMSATRVVAATPGGERVVLLDYVGDGP